MTMNIRKLFILLGSVLFLLLFDYHTLVAVEQNCKGDNYACQVPTRDEFNRLLVNDDVDRFALKYRGSFIRVLVPKSASIADFCKKFPGQECLDRPLFFSTAGQNDPRPILETFSNIYKNMTRAYWYSIRFRAEDRVYYDCVVQSLRQHEGKYGFECLSWNNEFLSQSEITDIYNQLKAVFSVDTLHYAPDGKYANRVEEVKGWPNPVFPILYDVLSLEDIATYNELISFTGYDLFQDRLMFVVPRPGNFAKFTAKHPAIVFPKTTLFCSTAFGNKHELFLQIQYPQLSTISLFELINKTDGIYHFGSIDQKPLDNGFYRFTTSRLDELFVYQEILDVYNQINQHFKVGPLRYDPPEGQQEAAAKTWPNPAFTIMFSDAEPQVDYEPYNQVKNFGYIKRVLVAEFLDAGRTGKINWQDIVVLDEAPFDSEAIFSGIITGTKQDPLSSHLSIRMANRGIPNAYVKNAYDVFAPYEGKLVELNVQTGSYTIREATIDEAESWWSKIRPNIQPTLPVNKTEQQIRNLLEMNDEPTSRFSRYGAKAANLSRLYQDVLKDQYAKYRFKGAGIPFHYFYEFMNDPANTIPDVTKGFADSTYWQYYLNLLNYDDFKSDPVQRAQLLNDFGVYMRDHGQIKKELVDQLVAKIQEIWNLDAAGKDKTTGEYVAVRFRSSSNSEDNLEFNGAGLYESTGMCLGDQLDGDNINPSKCYPDKKERTIERALKTVWTSLFNVRAFEERSYFQIRQDKIGMAILINTGTPENEDLNGVAFTGYPNRVQINSDIVDYVVNAQKGETPVVNPPPGIRAEIDIIHVSKLSDKILGLVRAQQSSEVPAGQLYVLTDDQLKEVGQTMLVIDKGFTIDPLEYPEKSIIKDIELKFVSGELKYKQVRPLRIGTIINRDFPREVPQAPSDLKIVQASPLQVELSWNSLANLVDQVLIERKVGAGDFQLYDTLAPNSLSYVDTQVAADTTYQYRVINENYNGVSLPSNPAIVTTPALISFKRGDVDGSGKVDISDPIGLLKHLFLGGAEPPCKEAANAEDDDKLDITDAIAILQHLFLGKGPLAEPFNHCGVDPAGQGRNLGCASYPASSCGP